MDEERIGENVYMNVLNGAERYAYFTTPYLIITDELSQAFALAAKRGVDVRIITPGIPDKKLIFLMTRSFYGQLAEAGVRIFEYSPGFIHAKQSVSDDRVATCGTINMDYRSLYHHFEMGTLMHGFKAIDDMKQDFDNLFGQCEEVTEKYRNISTVKRIVQLILRLISPLA
jgi:cardiolipin synthase